VAPASAFLGADIDFPGRSAPANFEPCNDDIAATTTMMTTETTMTEKKLMMERIKNILISVNISFSTSGQACVNEQEIKRKSSTSH